MANRVRYNLTLQQPTAERSLNDVCAAIVALGVDLDKEALGVRFVSGRGPHGLIEALRATPGVSHVAIDREASLA